MKVEEAKRSDADKFVLRFDAPGLRDALKARAAANRRSLNAELLSLIERGLIVCAGGDNSGVI